MIVTVYWLYLEHNRKLEPADELSKLNELKADSTSSLVLFVIIYVAVLIGSLFFRSKIISIRVKDCIYLLVAVMYLKSAIKNAVFLKLEGGEGSDEEE